MATSSIDLGLRGLHDVEVIGSGGSSVVYKAVREVPGSLAMQETVAVKVLRSSWDSAARRRFEREQLIMNRLSDTAGFVPILESGETTDGSPFIVMPFYEGGSLQQRMSRSGPVEWPRAVRLVEEVARTLDQAHVLDVFHRDIKPANILLAGTGRPHVADFGISFIADDPSSRATSTAAFTPAYSPPESFSEGLMPVATTDIYGLAATLWATLAGHAPFKEPGEQPTPVTVFGRVALHQVGDLRRTVPSPICHFIERAMAKIPEERPATMADFLSELQAAREDAYRGVEVERLEVTPLAAPGTERLLDGLTQVNGTEEPGIDGVGAAENGASASPAGSAVVDQKNERPDDGASMVEPVEADVVVEQPPAPVRRRGWLVTVAAAAASTAVVLLVAWSLLGPDDADTGDDSLVIVAEGESAADAVSSGQGVADDGAGGRSDLDPTTSTNADENVESDSVTSARSGSAGPTATTVPRATARRAAVGRTPTTAGTSTSASVSSGRVTVSTPSVGSGDLDVDVVSSTTTGSASTTEVTTSTRLPTAVSTSTETPATLGTTSTETPTTLGSTAIAFVTSPSVVSSTGSSLVFSYQTNDVCGTGSFEYIEAATGLSVGRWTGDRGCFGPVHFGDTRWPGITLSPGTEYLVTVTVEGQPSNGVLTAGSGRASTSFRVTTPG